MRSFSKMILGLGILFWFYLLKGGNMYYALQEFYKTAQQERATLSRRLVRYFLESPLHQLFSDYKFLITNVDNERLSTIVIEQYSDDSLHGYGDEDFNKGGATLETQQRGLILPVLENALKELILQARKQHVIVEIGTGNGDVIAYLARKYPGHRFVGVDFSVKTAREKHHAVTNLSFINGYALDLLESGALSGDVVFASSTFVVFTPKELATYFNSFRDSGFSQVILNEPVWAGHIQTNNSNVISKHMEGACWFHNYCGYLVAAGYHPRDFSFFHYRHPASDRPDIYVTIIRALIDEQ